jgi:hypothetical protein
MISSRDVIFHENNFKVSNEHITIATPSYVGSDTVFMDNSTSTWPDDIEDDLTNLSSLGEEVLACLDADKWIEAIKTELDTQYHQGTFKLDILPLGRKPVTCKWVFKLKKNS